MRKTQFHIIILLLCIIISCKKTSTPNEYLNEFKIEQSGYKRDKKLLAEIIKSRRDSIRTLSKTPEGKTLDVVIDTIFYNSNNKLVLLSVSKKENKYSQNYDKISYSGECYIGIKNESNEIKILKRLKYSSAFDNTDGFVSAKQSIRNIYLTEMEFIDGRFNINDSRFWTSKIWTEK